MGPPRHIRMKPCVDGGEPGLPTLPPLSKPPPAIRRCCSFAGNPELWSSRRVGGKSSNSSSTISSMFITSSSPWSTTSSSSTRLQGVDGLDEAMLQLLLPLLLSVPSFLSSSGWGDDDRCDNISSSWDDSEGSGESGGVVPVTRFGRACVIFYFYFYFFSNHKSTFY